MIGGSTFLFISFKCFKNVSFVHVSPDSSDAPRRPSTHGRHVSSSPETSSGPDDPDDLSLSEDIRVDPPDPDDALGAAARTTPVELPHRPVYEIVEDFTMSHDGDEGASVEIGVDVVGDVVDDQRNPASNNASWSNGASTRNGPPSAPMAPPSYDEVMASSANGGNIVHPPPSVQLPSSSRTNTRVESAATTTSTTTTSTPAVDVPDQETSQPTPHPFAVPPPTGLPDLSAAATPSESGTDSQTSSPNRFTGRRRIRLEELDRVEDIKDMTPRQLKEILVVNFVDYKGCCERSELEDRVKRLWNEHKTNQEMLRQTHERDEMASGGDTAATSSSLGAAGAAPTSSSASKAPSSHPDVDTQLCKICWDAVIDCVLLECGHMVTCTDCGRRMAECPICRQYVVRAVHVFRA